MKNAEDIIKWGFIKPYFDKKYSFNTIDIETVNNELFILGCTKNDEYYYYLDNFYDNFHEIIFDSIKDKKDILTWSRYDNTFILKLLLSIVPINKVNLLLERVGKVTPIFEYEYNNYKITIVNIIKDSIILKVDDLITKPKQITIYNLKNLYADNLEKVAKDYHINYYSKLGKEYHIIDKDRFNNDLKYKKNVLLSNKLDNLVLIDIASKMLENFKLISGVYPKSIFTNGSIARSYLLAYDKLTVKDLQFKTIFKNNKHFDKLLDYSMKSYHGGKIESYIIGYVPKAKIIDITSAYPYAFSKLPKITNSVTYFEGDTELDRFYYAFINCDIYIQNKNFIHPIITASPFKNANISPYGYIENVVITKLEYDYLIENGVDIKVHNYYGVGHLDIYPYKELVETLFDKRIIEKDIGNTSLADMYKTILNSLYGITYELTDVYEEVDNEIIWSGYRAGDYFNPILASYITATIRTYLSKVSYHIIENDGKVFLNMTDSIIYDGEVTLDIFSAKKILGTFEPPTDIKKLLILGAGRYEYEYIKNDKTKWIVKTRGFSAGESKKEFYQKFDLTEPKLIIEHKTFVTSFKATTNKFNFDKLGHLIEDVYKINPFNIGGKRLVDNYKVNLNKRYTTTSPIYLEKGIIKSSKN